METGAHSSESPCRGLRLLHGATAKGVEDMAPGFGLLRHVRIDAPDPIGERVRQDGGVGFRWEDRIEMRNRGAAAGERGRAVLPVSALPATDTRVERA